jgi:hypothetical protein
MDLGNEQYSRSAQEWKSESWWIQKIDLRKEELIVEFLTNKEKWTQEIDILMSSDRLILAGSDGFYGTWTSTRIYQDSCFTFTADCCKANQFLM